MPRIYIHNSLDELAERVGGVEMLPEEYGGSVPVSTMAWYTFNDFRMTIHYDYQIRSFDQNDDKLLDHLNRR